MVTIHSAPAHKFRYAVKVNGAYYTGHDDGGPVFDGEIGKGVKFESPEAVEAFVAEHKEHCKGKAHVPAANNQPGVMGWPARPQHVNAFDGYELVEVY